MGVLFVLLTHKSIHGRGKVCLQYWYNIICISELMPVSLNFMKLYYLWADAAQATKWLNTGSCCAQHSTPKWEWSDSPCWSGGQQILLSVFDQLKPINLSLQWRHLDKRSKDEHELLFNGISTLNHSMFCIRWPKLKETTGVRSNVHRMKQLKTPKQQSVHQQSPQCRGEGITILHVKKTSWVICSVAISVRFFYDANIIKLKAECLNSYLLLGFNPSCMLSSISQSAAFAEKMWL